MNKQLKDIEKQTGIPYQFLKQVSTPSKSKKISPMSRETLIKKACETASIQLSKQNVQKIPSCKKYIKSKNNK